ncbi:MAG: hypothetical protein AAF652_07410 [Cyanobacteria bacterium P01_C01_bin.72]
MKSDRLRLISSIRRTQEFLREKVETEKAEAESGYQELIETLDSYLNRLKSDIKPVIKIISPSRVLAEKLQRKNEADELLRSLYEFQVVSPIGNLRQIVKHCDLIVLLYDSSNTIHPHHYKLMELAQKAEIALFLLVRQAKSQVTKISYQDWFLAQDFLVQDKIRLPLDDFISLDEQKQIEIYQRSLVEFCSTVMDTQLDRSERVVKQEIKYFFNRQITHSWRARRQISSNYLDNEQLFFYQQQFRRNLSDNNQFRQQIIRDIKQSINHSKAELINPFATDSLIFRLLQIIDQAQVKAVKETDHVYLYLSLQHFPDHPDLHEYILDFCQQETNKLIDIQWSKVSRVYGYGGLTTLATKQTQSMKIFAPLLDSQSNIPEPVVSSAPNLNLSEIIDSYCLKYNSRVVFDYNYAQSSWFRLLISVLVGLIIYIITWLLLGEGRYIGFLIIIFQIINLITGQDIKKNKLKQHTKELKRTVDQRYQSLVRIMINQIAQTLIVAVDREYKEYQIQWSTAISAAQNKLNQLQQTNDRHKRKIEQFKSDRDKIESWF